MPLTHFGASIFSDASISAREKANRLYKKYIDVDSPLEVNLTHSIRRDLEAIFTTRQRSASITGVSTTESSMHSFQLLLAHSHDSTIGYTKLDASGLVTSFDQAAEAVEMLLQDSFQRFVSSPVRRVFSVDVVYLCVGRNLEGCGKRTKKR